jgi:hypothetical protein
MPIDPAQRQKIIDWFAKVPNTNPCYVCGNTQPPDITPDLFALPAVRNGQLSPNEIHVVVPTTCKSCGHTTFFSAAMMGLA